MAKEVTIPKTPVTPPVEPIVPPVKPVDPPPEEPPEEPPAEEPPAEEPPAEEPPAEEPPADDDMVGLAMAENKRLLKELEDFKNSNTNVFEQNEILKSELAEQEKLVKVAKENEELTAQLKTIKKNSLIDSLIAQGSITNELRPWAESVEYESLQVFAKSAPKRKSILEQKNGDGLVVDEDMEAWKKEQMKSRIVTQPQANR